MLKESEGKGKGTDNDKGKDKVVLHTTWGHLGGSRGIDPLILNLSKKLRYYKVFLFIQLMYN